MEYGGSHLGARDPQSDVLYLYSEYLAGTDPAIHAAAIRSRGDWIPGFIDPAANGRDQSDGYRLIQMYRNLGLHLESVDNPAEAGTLNVGQRMGSGRLKVFPSLAKYCDGRRLSKIATNGNRPGGRAGSPGGCNGRLGPHVCGRPSTMPDAPAPGGRGAAVGYESQLDRCHRIPH